MYKKCRVVLLPSLEKAPLMIDLNESSWSDTYKKLLYSKNFDFDEFDHTKNFTHTNKQHLYILSDDKIKEGDFYYLEKVGVRGSSSGIYKCESNIGSKLNTLATNCKKVIATTDYTLLNDDDFINSVTPFRNLPELSQQFIQQYVEAYNNGMPIEEVDVEYRLVDYAVEDDPNSSFKYGVITNSDNTINIKLLKDIWTREEVIKLLYSFGNKMESSEYNEPYWRYDNWIEENL